MRASQTALRWLALIILILSAGPLSAEPDGKKPNILFVIADDWGADHASAYGSKWVRTPAFDRMAREGILFQNAYTSNAKCAPSRASILTGRNSWQLEEAGNHLAFFPQKFRTFPEALGEHGYFVGITGKGWGPGVALKEDGSPRELNGRRFNARKLKPPTSGISNNDYAGNFAEFLEAAPAGQPWCFWAGTLEPHRGFEFGSGTRDTGKQLSDIPKVPGYLPDNDTVRQDLLDYALEVEHFDQHLGRMLADLEVRGLLENTIVVATSDHGMPFPRAKGQAYPHSNRVPLAIRWPKGIASPGRKVADYVNLVDLAPTFIEAAGLRWSQTGMIWSPGRSLQDIFASKKAGQVNPKRNFALVGKERHDVGRPHDWGYPIRGVEKDGFLYLRNFEPGRWPAGNPETGYLNTDGSPSKTVILEAGRANRSDQYWTAAFGKRPGEELYDLKKDPDCLNNLATLQKHEKRKQAMETRMREELALQQDPRIEGNGQVFDNYPVSNEETRNFHQRYMSGDKPRANWVTPTDFESGPLD